jgi:hypothetical protein
MGRAVRPESAKPVPKSASGKLKTPLELAADVGLGRIDRSGKGAEFTGSSKLRIASIHPTRQWTPYPLVGMPSGCSRPNTWQGERSEAPKPQEADGYIRVADYTPIIMTWLPQ